MPTPQQEPIPEPRDDPQPDTFVAMPSPLAGMSFRISFGPGQAEPLIWEDGSHSAPVSSDDRLPDSTAPAPAQPAEDGRENRFVSFRPTSWDHLLPGDVLALPGSLLLLTCRAGPGSESFDFVRFSRNIPAGFERFGIGTISRATFDLERVEDVIAPRSTTSFEQIGAALSRLPFARREVVAANIAALIEADPRNRLGGEFYLTADGSGAAQLANLVLRRPDGLLAGASRSGSDVPLTFVFKSAISSADSAITGFFESSKPDLSAITGHSPLASFTIDTLSGMDEDASDGELWESAYRSDDSADGDFALSPREDYELRLACELASRLIKIVHLG